MGADYFFAEARHYPALASIRYRFQNKNAGRPEDQGFIKTYVRYLEDETALGRIKVFCAAEGETIIGSVNLVLVPKSPKPDRPASKIGYVTNTYVLPEYRNGGIGTRLLENLEAYARDNSVELIIVWPSTRSVPYYERAGYSGQNEILEKRL